LVVIKTFVKSSIDWKLDERRLSKYHKMHQRNK